MNESAVEVFEAAPPADIAAEQAVLGAMILGGEEAVAEVAQALGEADFYRPAHQILFTALRDLADRGRPRDPVALAAELTRRGEIARVGGAPYLHTLAEAIPSVANAGYYAGIVAERARLRTRLDAALHLAQLARSDGDAGELVERMDAVWEQARSGAEDGDEQCEDLADIIPDVVDPPADDAQVIATPYLDLNHALNGGMRRGELVVIGGRPGHGKTTVALDIARKAAHDGNRVLFASLEMSREEIAQKVMAAESQVALSRVRDPSSRSEADYERMRTYVCADPLPITVDHRADSSVVRIRGRVRAMRRQGQPPAVVIVDYLQLLSMPGRATDTRERHVAETTRQLKLLAKDEDVVVVLLSQVNRDSARRGEGGGMPQLAELRESGGIEQDSNVVLMVHNPVADDPDTPRQGELDVKVAKNRAGSVTTIGLAAQLHYSRCMNMSR